jgi:hypothetical protein
MPLEKIKSYYKDNDDRVYAYLFYNEDTGFYEVHCYDGYSEEPPVIMCKIFPDAVFAAEEWVK